jgi:hypothetical protein
MAMSGLFPGLRGRPGLLADPRDQFKVLNLAASIGHTFVARYCAGSLSPVSERVACRR